MRGGVGETAEEGRGVRRRMKYQGSSAQLQEDACILCTCISRVCSTVMLLLVAESSSHSSLPLTG